MLTLADNPQETLTGKVWETWKGRGLTDRPSSLTWLEVSNLTRFFLSTCREKGLDWQSFDYRNILDPTLNYYENQSAIAEALGGPLSEEDEASYKDYMAKLAVEAEQTIQNEDQLSEKNMQLERQNKKLKAKEMESLNSEQIKTEISQINENQAAMLNKLEQLPYLSAQIKALQQSQNFKDLGNALSPVTTKLVKTVTNDGDPSKPLHYTNHGTGLEYCPFCGVKIDADTIQCWNCKAHLTDRKLDLKIPKFLKPKKPIKPLDAFAGSMVFIIWLAATGWILQSYALDFILAIEIAVFWIVFVVAFRVVAGGILD